MAVRWVALLGGLVVAVAVALLAVGLYTTYELVRDPGRLQGESETLNVTYEGPNASFTWSSTGYNVSFHDTSTDNGSTITSLVWDFGDGTGAANQTTTTHTYTETCGSCVVNVTLGVEDAMGRKSVATAAVLLQRTGTAYGTGESPQSQFHAPSLGPLSSGLPQAFEPIALMLLIGGSVANAGRNLLRREPGGTPVPVRPPTDRPA